MAARESGTAAALVAAALAGTGILAALALVASGKTETQADSRDVEALARMIASENPRGSLRLWIEQCWTQIRSRRKGQSIYDRITGGIGYGPQGGRRPVATVNEPSAWQRMVARLVLAGEHVSELPTARKFFEPREQDLLFQQAEAARAKQAKGQPITERERRILGYRHDAAGIRRMWASEGGHPLGTIDGVEFWT